MINYNPFEEADAVGVDSDMAGLTSKSDDFLKIRDYISSGDEIADVYIVAITGMAGIGKTRLVRKLYHDSSVKEKIECQEFIRVGQKYEFEVIVRAIVAQLNAVDRKDKLNMEGDHVDLKECFKTSLRGRKFLIVLDIYGMRNSSLKDSFHEMVMSW